MTYTNFTTEIGADGILVATWDMPGRSMNVIDESVMDDLDALISAVADDEAAKGCVIASGKDSFSGGADLAMLEKLLGRFKREAESDREAAAKALFEGAQRLSLIYRRLETCGKPFVAAINGTCLGGAFELALACHARIAAEGKGRMGLPEVKVGLLPGAGGTQRLPRMIPAGDALQMMLLGQQIDPNRASAMRLVDKVVPAERLLADAKEMVRSGAVAAKKPWDQDKFRLPGGPIYSPQGMMVFPPANAIYRRETYDNYPGARGILKCVYEGLLVSFDTGLRIEARYFANILQSTEAAAMIRTLFLSMQELNKGARRPAEAPRADLKMVGVVGAGLMGAGIAYVTAAAGIDVVLIDRDLEAAEKGRQYSHKLMSDRVNKGRASSADREALLARIRPSADYADLAACNLVIEAVFEDPKVKAEVIAAVEAAIGPDAVFGSNTSTLPITGLAQAAQRADRFIGIHFFSPVEKMMLVELIVGERTGDAALALALDYVRAIRKTPIVVNDSRGFYANRCVLAYVREGHLMLTEGVPPAMIENVARMAGMPVGPLSLNDEVALDLALRILKATKAQIGDAAIDPAQEKLLVELVENQGRLGRKNGKGFYDYPEKGRKRLWPGLADLQETHLDLDAIDIAELKHRFLVVQALEAARTVEEGVVTDPREADVGAILGFGFAPFTGGPLSYIDGMGAKAFVAICDTLAAAHGSRFDPNPLLRDMAERGETFYTRFAPERPKAAA